MKSFILLLVTATLMLSTGCGKSTPDNQIYSTNSEQVGWDHAKPVYQESVLIKPTWSQSFHYAKQGGWGLWLTFSIILFIGFCLLFSLAVIDSLPRLFEKEALKFLSLFLLLAGSLCCFFGQPGSLKTNNDHWVPKPQYDYYMQSKGDIAPIWDSLANNCHMPWGPYKGCKK